MHSFVNHSHIFNYNKPMLSCIVQYNRLIPDVKRFVIKNFIDAIYSSERTAYEHLLYITNSESTYQHLEGIPANRTRRFRTHDVGSL